jgi:hypothetical protein
MRRSLRLLPFLCIGLAGCGTPKDMWLLTMETTLPLTACEVDYFEECFEWTADECQAAAKPFVKACGEELSEQLPSTINAFDGSKWGEKLGACAGERLASANTDRFTLTESCEDAVLAQSGPEVLEQIRREVASGQLGK